MAKDNVTIGDMTVGYSGKGMSNFKDSLEEMLVNEVEDALDDLQEVVLTNLSNCWTGEAKNEYVRRLKKQIDNVEEQLQEEWKDVKARLTEVGNFYTAQDEALSDWEG